MKEYNMNQIKNYYWKIETINQKHKTAHLAAEIFYCAHIFIGFAILILKLDFFNSFNAVFVNPPVWLGVIFPLLTLGKYAFSIKMVIGTLLCLIAVPPILSVLVYLLFSIPLKKTDSIKNNPYRKLRDNDVLEKIFQTTPSCFKVLKVLESRIHVLVWIQVVCVGVLFLLFMIYGIINKMVLPGEIGMGILVMVLVSPSCCIPLYILRWFQRKIYAPVYKLLNVIYLKRMKKVLNDVRDCKAYINYINATNAKFQAEEAAKEKARRAEKLRKAEIARKAKKYAQESPVFVEDIIRRMESQNTSNSDINKDPLGYGDGVPVDSTGM